MSTALLEVRRLRCERDDRVLFEDLDFHVSRGELLQVEGPNGSGKTTMLRALCGLSGRFEGDIFWCGEQVDRVRGDYLAHLLYLGHAAGIKASLTPRENLTWSVAARVNRARMSVDEALDRVGLYGFEDAPCFTLSAGQQRRVNLARLFLTDAALWILDEPFTAIDKAGVAELEAWIVEHAKSGGAAILTTHHKLGHEVPVRRLALGGW